MINLTRGVPAPESYALNDFAACFAKAMQEDGRRACAYNATPGYAPLIELLADQYGVKTDQVLVGNGSLELFYFLTMTELESGDKVIVEGPSYDRTNLLLKRRGVVPVEVALEDDGVNLNALEDAMKAHQPKYFYCIPDFQNPTGSTLSVEKREAIGALAEKYNVNILEDSPYRSLRYFGEDLPPLSDFIDPERVLRASSFSKTMAPGLRVGYLIGNAAILSRIKAFIGNSYIGPASVTQAAAYRFFKDGYFEPNLRKLKDLYRPRLVRTLELLDERLGCAAYARPEGGFFIGVTLPEGNRMETLIPAAKAAGLNISDGRGFYLDPSLGERFLRIPFCGLKPEELEAAFDVLVPLIQR